tara:strand:+ start:111155 stop:111292 length:138 start_codon:yes stop_codon:yes gene_type:complete
VHCLTDPATIPGAGYAGGRAVEQTDCLRAGGVRSHHQGAHDRHLP